MNPVSPGLTRPAWTAAAASAEVAGIDVGAPKRPFGLAAHPEIEGRADVVGKIEHVDGRVGGEKAAVEQLPDLPLRQLSAPVEIADEFLHGLHCGSPSMLTTAP